MQRMSRRLVAVTALLVLLAGAGSPAAAQVTANGFFVNQEANISATPPGVYAALIGQVGSWWNPEHTFSGDSRNLSIDARPGGCFCERLRDGGGVEHLRVIYVAPGEIVRMSGALGPLQGSGVTGTLTWKLSAASPGTAVGLSYSVGGFFQGGFEKIAPAVEAVLGEQLRRLKLFVETGKPTRDAGR